MALMKDHVVLWPSLGSRLLMNEDQACFLELIIVLFLRASAHLFFSRLLSMMAIGETVAFLFQLVWQRKQPPGRNRSTRDGEVL